MFFSILFLLLLTNIAYSYVDEGFTTTKSATTKIAITTIKTIETTKISAQTTKTSVTTKSSYGCYCSPSCSSTASCSFANSGVVRCPDSYCSKTTKTTTVKTTPKTTKTTTVSCVQEGGECQVGKKCCTGLVCYRGECIPKSQVPVNVRITTTTASAAKKVFPVKAKVCPDGQLKQVDIAPMGRGASEVDLEYIYRVTVCVPKNADLDEIVGKIYKGEIPVQSLKQISKKIGIGISSDLKGLASTLEQKYNINTGCALSREEKPGFLGFFSSPKLYVCYGESNIIQNQPNTVRG